LWVVVRSDPGHLLAHASRTNFYPTPAHTLDCDAVATRDSSSALAARTSQRLFCRGQMRLPDCEVVACPSRSVLSVMSLDRGVAQPPFLLSAPTSVPALFSWIVSGLSSLELRSWVFGVTSGSGHIASCRHLTHSVL
jgi:hypothetical protein